MTTWTTLNSQLDRLLNDAPVAGQSLSYPADLRLLCFNRAAEFFAATHTASLKIAVLSAFTAQEDGAAAILPADLLQIGGVKVNGAWLARNEGYIQMTPSTIHFTDQTLASASLWYYANYPTLAAYVPAVPPADPSTEPDCGLPSWAEWPVMNLALAYLLTPNMIGQAIFRQYQSKREAGDPETNPPREQAIHFMKVYADEIAKVKPQDREAMFQ